MVEHNRFSPHELVGRFLCDELSPTQQKELLDLVENHSGVVTILVRNIISDLWLSELFSSDYHKERLNQTILFPLNDIKSDEDRQLEKMFGFDFPSTPAKVNSHVIICDNPADVVPQSSYFRVLPNGKKEYRIKQGFFDTIWRKILFTSLSVLVMTLLTYIVIWAISSWTSIHSTENDTFIPVAKLLEVVEPQWQDEQCSYQRGQSIPEGKITLKSGLIQLQMESGARLILEGPVELSLDDPMNVFCQKGRISVEVPPKAIGFDINTPYGHVIDQGTEFFLSVSPNDLQLNVIKGTVDLVSHDNIVERLTTGLASQIDMSQKIISVSPNTDSFFSRERFDVTVNHHTEELEKIQDEAITAINQSPKLLAHFNFQKIQKQIYNQSIDGRVTVKKANIPDAKWGEGSLKNRSAILCTDTKSQILFELPQSYENLTVFARVRIDRLQNYGNTILASQEFLNERGAILWQFLKTGEMKLQIQYQDSTLANFTSPRVIQAKTYGVWCNIAIVLNANRKTITFWQNGQQISQHQWDNPIPLVPGKMTFGNIVETDKNQTNRYLGGAVENIMIFKSPLSAKEIKNIP